MRALLIALTVAVLMSAHAVAQDSSTGSDWDWEELSQYSGWALKAYNAVRPLCRQGPSELSDISCKALRAYGDLLVKTGYCFDKSEVEWVNCKPIHTDVAPEKKPQ